jgi:hypothetical protein
MDRELEIAGAASLGGWLKWKKHHTLPAGSPCPNCATPLNGPYCHECGQLGEQFDRSILPLIWEAFESFFHADGRLLHTLPRLVLRPAVLTNDYLEGRRASQVPPLRMFLVVMLIFFFVGGLKGHNEFRVAGPEALKDPEVSALVKERTGGAVTIDPVKPQAGIGGTGDGFGAWIKPRVIYAAAHPHEFTLIFESWTHRIAVAMLPVAAAILSLLFVFSRRRFYVYDHLIFAMHSLSFMGLLASAQSLIGLIPVVGTISGALILAAPVHLFIHLRGVYRTGVFGTVWREIVLILLSLVAFALMMGAVTLVGLSEMRMDAPGKSGAGVAQASTLS